MSPEYHGWTHRPKAQGGTDPVVFDAPGVSWVHTIGDGNDEGTPNFRYRNHVNIGPATGGRNVVTNDPDTFAYDDTDAATGALRVLRPGWYEWYCQVDIEFADIADLPDEMFIHLVHAGGTFIEPGMNAGNASDMMVGLRKPTVITPANSTEWYRTVQFPQVKITAPIDETFLPSASFNPYLYTSNGTGSWVFGVFYWIVRLGDLTSEDITTIAP